VPCKLSQASLIAVISSGDFSAGKELSLDFAAHPDNRADVIKAPTIRKGVRNTLGIGQG
jgi:hypothetical protein